MDAAQPRLQLAGEGEKFAIVHRSVDRRTYQNGSGAERVQVRGPAGHTAEVAYPLGRAPVIQELRVRANFVSNRAGVRLGARVVLPRSIDPATGRPFELLIRAGGVGSGRNWEQLVLDDVPTLLANQARVARSQRRLPLDERGAFVSQIVFLTPGGTGITELIVDRVEVFGVVDSQSRPTIVNPDNQPNDPTAKPMLARDEHQRQPQHRKVVRVPRIIQWQGEPFEFLQNLGFNTIALDRMPTSAELRQAEGLGLGIFCPPPSPLEIDKESITAEHNAVLAWNLGDQLSTDDLAHVERWERLVTRYDPVTIRPTVLAPRLNTLEASRVTDVILVGRPVVGTDLDLREHSAWLSQRQHLARPGTPTWTKIETQPSPRQRLQMAALSSTVAANTAATYDQLCGLVAAALGIKSQGFYFESQTALDGNDPATRQRAAALQLTNYRIQLVEPWLLAGKGVSKAQSPRADLSALVLQAERSRLLVPVWWQQNMQSRLHPRVGGPISFVVPGVAESSEAFLVTVGGIQRARHRRVTGGVRVSLDELPQDGFILLSDDPRAIAQVTQYVRRISKRGAQLRRELADMHLQQATSVAARLNSSSSEVGTATTLIAESNAELATSDRQLEAGNFARAYQHADTGDLAINRLKQHLTQRAGVAPVLGSTAVSQVSIPLPEQLELRRKLTRAPLSTNLLRGGGFEDLSALLEYGWRHKQLKVDGVTTSVRLSPDGPHSGTYCLELEARPIDASAPMTIVPTAPVWITSSPVSVQQGDLLEVTGVARLSEPLIGTIDGLQVIDSLGGVDMALRIQDAPTWQPFKLVRAAGSDTEVSVTIALSGLGKAQIDDVALRVIRE